MAIFMVRFFRFILLELEHTLSTMGRKAAMVAVLAKNMERQPAVRPEIKRKRRSLSLESRITCPANQGSSSCLKHGIAYDHGTKEKIDDGTGEAGKGVGQFAYMEKNHEKTAESACNNGRQPFL